MTMRTKAILAVTAVACVAASLPAEAARPRRQRMHYEASDTAVTGGAGGQSAGFGTTDAGYYFPVREGETAVSVLLLDDREQPVAGVVAQVTYEGGNGTVGTGRFVTEERFCGRTQKPVKIDPDLEVRIIVEKGACADGTPSLPTSGQIIVDFHRR